MAPTERQVSRADQLLHAAQKAKRRLDADPNGPNADRLRERLGEYEESLTALQEGRPVTRRGEGVNIDVPAGLFNTEAKAHGKAGGRK